MRGVLAQEIHHRVKNNLQTVASLLRLQARADGVDPREALEHSVNRILAIAAVHEVLTEQRDEDVELAELIDRLRAMLVQGLGGGRDVDGAARARLARRQPRDGARARLQRAAPERARARRRRGARSSSRSATATSCSRSPTRAPASTTPSAGTGLSIVRALVRDELHGSFDLRDGGTRAEVCSPHEAARRRCSSSSGAARSTSSCTARRAAARTGTAIAGGVEEGESFAEAAARELHEETGLAAQPAEIAEPFVYPSDGPIAGVVDVVGCFLVDAPDGLGARRSNDEHDDYRWCAQRRGVELLCSAGSASAVIEPAPPYAAKGRTRSGT